MYLETLSQEYSDYSAVSFVLLSQRMYQMKYRLIASQAF